MPKSMGVSNLVSRIGELRNKDKYPYNIGGVVDFQIMALAEELCNTRLSIGAAHFWKRLGLTKLTPVNTDYGEFRAFSRRQDFRDTWFYLSVDDSYSRIYNCWQRIANILNTFFKVISNPRYVLLKPVLDNIGKNYPEVNNDSSYRWLKNFLDHKYSMQINYRRQEITHVECSSNAYLTEFLMKITKPEEQDALEKERDKWPELLIEYYSVVLSGVDHMLTLITNQFK
jgi:hypothetical protein